MRPQLTAQWKSGVTSFTFWETWGFYLTRWTINWPANRPDNVIRHLSLGRFKKVVYENKSPNTEKKLEVRHLNENSNSIARAMHRQREIYV